MLSTIMSCVTYDCLALILTIELTLHHIGIVVNVIMIRNMQNYTCNLVESICNIISFQLFSRRRSFYLMKRSDFKYITGSLHGTHPPFHIIISSLSNLGECCLHGTRADFGVPSYNVAGDHSRDKAIN